MPTQRAQISDELMVLLGKIVVKFAYLEMMVSDLFVHMTKGEPAAMVVVTSNASQNAISGWIRTLLDLLEQQPEWSNDCRKTLTEIDEVRRERNNLIHGHWTPNETGSTALVHTARLERSEVLRSELVTALDLNDTLNNIQNVTIYFVSILRSAGVTGY